MTIFPRFAYPWILTLLVLVPISVWLGIQIRSLSAGRKWLAITLRSLILISLIAALAGAELVRTTDRLAVFFLLDRSNSIPESIKETTIRSVQTICDVYMTPRDEAGVIAFGDEASIELTVDPAMQLEKIESFVNGEQTDAASAVRLAMAAFPQGYMKRIVLMTDGNETKGSMQEEVKLAQAAGVAVDIMPVHIGGVNEVRMREVAAPSRIDTDEPFKLKVVAHADQDCEGTLRVYQRLSSGKRLLSTQKVILQEGDNAWLLPQELDRAGFYEYEATIESDSDTVMANNEGRAFTFIQGEPLVLYVDSEPQNSIYLTPALQKEGIRVASVPLDSMPTSLAALQNYDAVVLGNVSATDLTSEQLRSLEAMVRDLGIGLVMIGGPESFGAGGFYDTAVERALPVNMDLKQRKVMPRGALVLCLHTCEFQDGNAWARDISIAALNVLSSQDLMGALAYDYQGGDSWVFELQPVGDKHAMRMALNTGTIGDMPSVEPTLTMAYKALANCDASVKRVVMISDGDPAAPSTGLLKKLNEAKISVSTVCINPHRPNDQHMLSWVAERTGGNFYFVTNPQNLPQIFTKEAAVVKRSLLYEKPFTPQVLHNSELLRGAGESGFPILNGYVVTTPKENATLPLISSEGDPVLAHWRYGLGKSVAFTSDVTTRWAGEWVKWDGFNRFWAQSVRWAVRELAPSNFRVETKLKDGMGYVRIDAVDDQGNYVNFLRPRGVVTGPPPSFERSSLTLMQTGPGIYEGRFPVDNRGVYMMSIVYSKPDGSEGMIPAGLALNYSKEYDYNTTNIALLENLAEVGGGRILEARSNPFQHDLVATPTITSIWQYLVAFAACLFPLEIFIRRVVLDFSFVYVWLARMLRALPGLKSLIPMPALRPQVVTGAYGGMSRESRGRVFDASGVSLPDGPSAELDTLEPPPGAERPQQPSGSLEAQAPGHSEYTRQLLAAKQRALQSRGKRGSSRK
ncbi:MAG: VWA domain-containing protein [bacterium]|nr:VWA domain-containing protein [bacterium]